MKCALLRATCNGSGKMVWITYLHACLGWVSAQLRWSHHQLIVLWNNVLRRFVWNWAELWQASIWSLNGDLFDLIVVYTALFHIQQNNSHVYPFSCAGSVGQCQIFRLGRTLRDGTLQTTEGLIHGNIIFDRLTRVTFMIRSCTSSPGCIDVCC